MLIVKSVLIVVAVILVAVLAVGQAGLLKGKETSQLGVRDGRLTPPSPTPNSVSSQAALYLEPGQRSFASIEPLPLRGSGPETIAKLKSIVGSMAGAEIIRSEPDYLYAQYTTRLMNTSTTSSSGSTRPAR
jgi:uncharacterized protein (DUF1499 family)